MRCSYCQGEFEMEASRKACAGCSFVGGGCQGVKCPRCGFEMPAPIEVPKLFRRLFGRGEAKVQG